MSRCDYRRAMAISAYNRYLKSNYHNLSDCYGTYSCRKAQAWDFCKYLMMENDGWNLRIISKNGWQFTAGFMFEKNGHTCFMYITKSFHQSIDVDLVN